MKPLPTLLTAIAAMVFVLACSKETEAPPRNFESVHPSLERQSKLNHDRVFPRLVAATSSL